MADKSVQLTEELLIAIRAQPGFAVACQEASAKAVRLFRDLDPPYQWITKDLGRASICLTAAMLHYSGGLTVQNLTAICVTNRVSSPGRVRQVVRRCREMGQFRVEEGPGKWTRRPAHVGPSILVMLRQRALCDMEAAITLAPELGGALPIMETEEGFVSGLMQLALATTKHRDLFAFATRRPTNFFLDREAGMLILLDLLASQPPGRNRLLGEAALSRSALSRRYGVSRAHINKLLSESGHATVTGDRVVFSNVLSSALEDHFALVFAHNQTVARTLLSGWRYNRRQDRGSSAAHAA
jgi:hypothetical protein